MGLAHVRSTDAPLLLPCRKDRRLDVWPSRLTSNRSSNGWRGPVDGPPPPTP